MSCLASSAMTCVMPMTVPKKPIMGVAQMMIRTRA